LQGSDKEVYYMVRYSRRGTIGTSDLDSLGCGDKAGEEIVGPSAASPMYNAANPLIMLTVRGHDSQNSAETRITHRDHKKSAI